MIPIKRTLTGAFRLVLCLPSKNSEPGPDAFRLVDFSVFTARAIARIVLATVVAVILMMLPASTGIFQAVGAVLLSFCAGMIAAYFFPVFRQRAGFNQDEDRVEESIPAETPAQSTVELSSAIQEEVPIAPESGTDRVPEGSIEATATTIQDIPSAEKKTAAAPRRRRTRKTTEKSEAATAEESSVPTPGEPIQAATPPKKPPASRTRKTKPVQATIEFE